MIWSIVNGFIFEAVVDGQAARSLVDSAAMSAYGT